MQDEISSRFAMLKFHPTPKIIIMEEKSGSQTLVQNEQEDVRSRKY